MSIHAFGQSNAPQVANQVQADSLLTVFQQQQQLIVKAFSDLMLQGPTQEDVENWQQENAGVFADQQQRAIALGSFSSAQPLAYISEVNIPSGATSELSDFLAVRANLYNSYSKLHNQAVSESRSASDVQTAYQAQNAMEIRAQAQRAQDITTGAANQPLPVPPPLVIPPAASPTLQTFMALRDQLMRGHVALWNQYVGASSADRDAALAQWQQENAALSQQMQHLAQQLAQNGGH